VLKNYIKTAVRNFLRHKSTTAINIFGLAVGISASLVIFMMVEYDYSFDKWQPQANNIYRVIAQSGHGNFPGVPMPAPAAIKSQVTGIETLASFMEYPNRELVVTLPSVANGMDKPLINEKDIVFADENYFKIFPHQWLSGNPSAALSRPNTVVLSLSVAQKYFPGTTPDKIIGQPVKYDSITAIVSGIVADLTEHTDFNNKTFISYSTFTSNSQWNSKDILDNWTFPDYRNNCFIRLNKNTNLANITRQLKKLYSLNVVVPDPNFTFTAALQPLTEVHFGIYNNGKYVLGKADKTVLVNLAALALALLLLAAINFINLSTAQSSLRAKEIGVRKTFGSQNRHIMLQFLTEMFFTTLCATVLAIALAPFLLYVFKGFIPEGLGVQQLLRPVVFAFLAALVVLVTLLAGLYPGFVLTRFKPAMVLKAQVISAGKSRGAWVRQVLTVTQFVVAQFFLIAVIVVGRQINYELNTDPGIRKDAIVSFRVPGRQSSDNDKRDRLVSELRKVPQIQNITCYSGGEPFSNGAIQLSLSYKGISQPKLTSYKDGDTNYIKVFNIPLLAGRNVRIDTTGLHGEVLVNATMARQMGFKNAQDAVGAYISPGEPTRYTVAGVMKDFNIQSLHSPLDPLVFMGNNPIGGKISLALNPADPSSWHTALQRTEQEFKKIYPNRDFSFTFFDEAIAKVYESDTRLATLLKWATGLAVFISCLGLFGLVSFMANHRAKEIGIRRVLGATVIQNIGLLSKSLIGLVALASVIAFPVAWYFSNNWLKDFAFKTTISWWIFLISGAGMLLIGLAVLCARTLKVATANPVKSLRAE